MHMVNCNTLLERDYDLLYNLDIDILLKSGEIITNNNHLKKFITHLINHIPDLKLRLPLP